MKQINRETLLKAIGIVEGVACTVTGGAENALVAVAKMLNRVLTDEEKGADNEHGKKCDLKCTHRDIAETIYTANYRKQSENTIELPCKIGDTVYIIDEAEDECGEDYVLAVKVLQFFINKHGVAIDLELPLGMRLNTCMVVGENVFLTEEEAKKALAKMKGGAE